MNKDTLEKLKELKLYGMYNAFKASLENYNRNNMTIDKFVNQERKGGHGLYTREDFSKLTRTDIDLNETQIGGKPVTKYTIGAVEG